MTFRGGWTVIGVSGVTCGGKTTLASALQSAFPGSLIVNQDTYFLPADDPRHTPLPHLKHLNWELISALDMTRMVADIRHILDSPVPEAGAPLLIIEGFLIFSDPYILSVCDYKVFFTLTYDECWARRSVRSYDPADVPGYFEQVIWPEYLKYLEHTLDTVPDLKLIPGTRDIDSVVQDYTRIITENLNVKTC